MLERGPKTTYVQPGPHVQNLCSTPGVTWEAQARPPDTMHHIRGDGLELEGLLLRTGVTGTPSAACLGGGYFPVTPSLSGTSPDLHQEPRTEVFTAALPGRPRRPALGPAVQKPSKPTSQTRSECGVKHGSWGRPPGPWAT